MGDERRAGALRHAAENLEVAEVHARKGSHKAAEILLEISDAWVRLAGRFSDEKGR